MLTAVYSDATSTTNVVNTNSNTLSQSIDWDNCTVISGGDINISQAATQVQSIVQTATMQNEQVAETTVNQSLLQQAQSTVSDWGIGVAAAQNNMSVTAALSTSMQSVINSSFSNLNSASQNFVCTNSTFISQGAISETQTGGQEISASQTTNTSQTQSITNAVSQVATQTATATVAGVDLVGMIVAVVVLLVVAGIVFAIVKSKASGIQKEAVENAASLKGGGMWPKPPFGLVPLSTSEGRLYGCGVVLIIVLATMGALGLNERANLACDFNSQCQSTSGQFWFSTELSTCSTGDRGLGTEVVTPMSLPTKVSPPLFMCNPVQSSVPFGASTANGLFPGTLQCMIVTKHLSYYAESAEQRNNMGYNLGVYSELLNVAEASDAAMIRALVVYFQRQILTIGDDNGGLIKTPNGSTSLTGSWCATRIIQNLLPLQPVYASPDESTCGTLLKDGTSVDPHNLASSCTGSPDKTTTLRRPAGSSSRRSSIGRASLHVGKLTFATGLVEALAAQRERRLSAAKNAVSTSASATSSRASLGKPGPRIGRTATRLLPRREAPAGTAARVPRTAASASRATSTEMGAAQRPAKAVLAATTTDCTPSGLDTSGAFKTTAIARTRQMFSSSGNNPSGFNLHADVCYKSTGITSRPHVFKTPSGCPTSTCQLTTSMMVTNVVVVSGGSGYNAATTVQFTGGNVWGLAAQGTVYINAEGSVHSVIVTWGGTQYTTAPAVVLYPPSSTNDPALLTAVLGALCMSKDDDSRQCISRCGDGSDGWLSFQRNQGAVVHWIDPAQPCVDTGLDAKDKPASFFHNGLWSTPTATQCRISAGAATYYADTNTNNQTTVECKPTQMNTYTSASLPDCDFRALDDSFDADPQPVWMATYNVGVGEDITPKTLGHPMSQSSLSQAFFADLNSVAASAIGSTTVCGSGENLGCTGEWSLAKSGVPDTALEGSITYANPYCNAIIGICQSQDPTRVDYDADCPAHQEANYAYRDGAAIGYSSTCAQQPVTGCGAYFKGGASAVNPVNTERVCSAGNRKACWSKTLCAAVNGTWTLDDVNGGYYCSDDASCPSTMLYDSGGSDIGACSSCAAQATCTATTYANDDCAACGNNMSQTACDNNNKTTAKTTSGAACKCNWDNAKCTSTVPLADSGCAWTTSGTCITGCLPSANVCDNCAEKGCAAPCSWDSTLTSVQITDAGAGYSTTPGAVTATIISNGAGQGAQLSVIVSPGLVTALTLSSGGSGYQNPPTVSVIQGSGFVAVATISDIDNSVTSITVQNGGSNYYDGSANVALTSTDASTGAVTDVTLGGFAATAVVVNGSVVSVTVSNGGTRYETVPNVTVNQGTGFAATAVVTNGAITAINVTSVGIGYSPSILVALSAAGNTAVGCKGNAVVVGGAVQSVVVSSGGSGYGPVTTMSGGGGTGAVASAIVVQGVITGFRLLSNGSGYTTAPTVSIEGASGSGAAAICSVQVGIVAVDVVSGGYGYTEAVTVSFENNSQAAPTRAAQATVQVGGSCSLGVNLCAAAADQSSVLSSLFVVRLPGSFLKTNLDAVAQTAASAASCVNYGCLPNIFIPDVANTSSTVFAGNCANASTGKAAYRSCCQSTTPLPTLTAVTYQSLMQTTCVSRAAGTGTATAPNLTTDYTCGCPNISSSGSCWADGTSSSDSADYSPYDVLCHVSHKMGAADTGGFILRKASTFGATTSPSNSIYGLTATSPDPDLYVYAAAPSNTVSSWTQMNTTTQGRDRLFMFMRVLYWLILSVDVTQQTLSELGLGTFVNNLGYNSTSMKPSVYVSDARISQAAMYGTQPLLVWDRTGVTPVPLFFTLQELKEGMVNCGSVDSGFNPPSSARVPVPNAASYLQQLTMWCYDPTTLASSTDVSLSGFNVVIPANTNSGTELQQQGNMKGLMYGAYGYCNTWFTDDRFVGATLGIACALLAALVVYSVMINRVGTKAGSV